MKKVDTTVNPADLGTMQRGDLSGSKAASQAIYQFLGINRSWKGVEPAHTFSDDSTVGQAEVHAYTTGGGVVKVLHTVGWNFRERGAVTRTV